MLHTYNPAEVSTIVGAFNMQGFADGSFVTIEMNEDAWNLYVGSDGEGARSKSNNRSGTITIRLMQTSSSNEILSALYKSDDVGDAGITNILIKDSSGSTLAMAENAWIRKLPAVDFARESGEREWVFESDNIQVFVGSN